MALLFETDSAGPGTHVLLIGAGAYPHLDGRLAGSAQSADGLAGWFRSEYRNPAAPLATLDLLTSGPGPTTDPLGIDILAGAIQRWHGLANAHPDNIAFFYFAGHGLRTSAGDCLLADDIAGPEGPASPLDQAIGVDPLLAGFGSGPERQIWLFDISRNTATGRYEKIFPRRVLEPAGRGSIALRRLVLYSALPGQEAYAPSQGPSYFAQALLGSLRGSEGPVGTGELAERVQSRLATLALGRVPARIESSLTGEGFIFHGAPAAAAKPAEKVQLSESVARPSPAPRKVSKRNPPAGPAIASLESETLSPPAPAATPPEPDQPAPAPESTAEAHPSTAADRAPAVAQPESPAEPVQAAPLPPPTSPPAEAVRDQAGAEPDPPPDLEFIDDDAQLEVDNLGRGPLAVVVARRLHTIWSNLNKPDQKARGGSRSAFVLHLDAPWGGGKTSFANFVARVLNPYGFGGRPALFLREHYGETAQLAGIFAADPPKVDGAAGGEGETAAAGAEPPAMAEDMRRPWIVIDYNAWRTEHCAPPWWAFYQAIRKGCFGAVLREGDAAVDLSAPAGPAPNAFTRAGSALVRAGRWSWLWICELAWRLWTPRLIVPAFGFLVFTALYLLLSALGIVGLSGKAGEEKLAFSTDSAGGRIMLALGALTAIGGLVSLVMESLAPGVDPLAERLGLGRSDPLERFRRHFHRTMLRLRRPILVIVDDLDRCKPAVIVDLVRGMQTILRSPRVVFLILGDREWLERAFEAVHADMAKVSGGAEQSVGARFVEKAIQLSFLLPGLDPARQSGYVSELLERGRRRQASGDVSKALDLRAEARVAVKGQAEAAFDSEQLRNAVLATPVGQAYLDEAKEQLRAAPKAPESEEALEQEAQRLASQVVNEELAIQAAAAPLVDAETARRLQPLSPWLPGNPRQIKRILNGIALYHAAALQHPTFTTSRRWFQLAIWVVVMTEWPATWRLLAAYPELADALRKADLAAAIGGIDEDQLPGSPAATLIELQRIRNTRELMALIAGEDGRAGPLLDTQAIRELLSLTPPYARPPRLADPPPAQQPAPIAPATSPAPAASEPAAA